MKNLFIFIMFGISLFGTNLKIGDQAPEFSLKNQDGEICYLGKYKGNKLVIYFFPKAFTPGWIKQACGLRDESKKFEDFDITVLGVSYDSESKLKAFKEEYNLPFDLLSDSDKIMGSAYGVNSFYFFPQRKTFLIDEEGMLVHVFDSVNLNSHPEDILSNFNQSE